MNGELTFPISSIVKGGEKLSIRRAVVYLVKDERLVVLVSVVFDCVKHCRWLKDIHNLNPIKVDHDSATGTTRHILDLVGLKCGLNVSHSCQKGQHHMEARPSHSP